MKDSLEIKLKSGESIIASREDVTYYSSKLTGSFLIFPEDLNTRLKDVSNYFNKNKYPLIISEGKFTSISGVTDSFVHEKIIPKDSINYICLL